MPTMKRIVLLLFMSLLLFNCSQEKDEPFFVEVIKETASSFKGTFISGAHPTSGQVLVDTNKTKISLVNFKTDPGPKLLVYLTTSVGSSDYVSLGDLKGTSGNFTYNIPSNTDLEKYKVVDIWCVDFSVSFGHATLE